MSFFRRIQEVKAQIVNTERMLNLVGDHPIMSLNFQERLTELNEELASYPEGVLEPKVRLLFSGNAVKGSIGIKTSFVSKALNPFQAIVRTQASQIRFGNTDKKKANNKKANTDLYITALPTGSFGVELSQLDANDLFAEQEVAKAIRQTVELIHSASISDEEFEKATENAPKNSLTSLKAFFKEVANKNSILKMESGELLFQIPENEVKTAFERVDATTSEEEEEFIVGILRGFLLDSGRFELINEDGKLIKGFISNQLSEEELVSYSNDFLNKQCRIHVMVYKTTFRTGKQSSKYELLEITSEL